MAKVKGVCKNIDDCRKAEIREVQEVEKSAPFICEECGKPLSSPVKEKPGTSNNKLIFIIVGIVVLLASVGGVLFLTNQSSEENVLPPKETPTVVDEPKDSAPHVIIDEGDEASGTGKGTISFDYGKYKGEIKNFQANGSGSFVFYKAHPLSKWDKQKREAVAKDYVVGEFKENDLINGKWFGEDQSQKGAVITQELGIP